MGYYLGYFVNFYKFPLFYCIIVFLVNFYFGKLSWAVRDSWFVSVSACGEEDHQSQCSSAAAAAQQTSAWIIENKHERSLSDSALSCQRTAIQLALFYPYFDPWVSGKLSNLEEDGEVRIYIYDGGNKSQWWWCCCCKSLALCRLMLIIRNTEADVW